MTKYSYQKIEEFVTDVKERNMTTVCIQSNSIITEDVLNREEYLNVRIFYRFFHFNLLFINFFLFSIHSSIAESVDEQMNSQRYSMEYSFNTRSIPRMFFGKRPTHNEEG